MKDPQIRPPKWAIWLVKRCIRPAYHEELLGDLEEVFQELLDETSPKRAKRQFVLETLKILKPNLIRKFTWMQRKYQFAMLRNHFITAFRSLLRFRMHALINLVGLAIGLAMSALMFYYISDEYSFDHQHSLGDRIYRIVSLPDGGDGIMETNAWPVGHKLVTEYPEVEAVVYAKNASRQLKLNHDGKRVDHKIHYASEEFFKLFDFEMTEGNPNTALSTPFSIVITESVKQQYLKDQALGEVITLGDSIDFKITGVVKNPPKNSHIQFDMLISFSSYEKISGWFSYTDGWGNFNVRNYLLLKEGASITSLESKATDLYMENVGDWLTEMGMSIKVGFIPLKDVYLRSGLYNGFGPSGSLQRVKVVSLIAIFVLLLACINYINLSTARSAYRSKEVGMRKVAGSSRFSLIIQFLTESLVITFLSFLAAVLIIYLGLPFFNQILEKNYSIWTLLTLNNILAASAMIVSVSILAGLYPAMHLAALKPLKAISGNLNNGGGISLRKGLIVFQFFTAASVILFTFLVIYQVQYMQNRPLGFDKNQVLILDASNVSNRSSTQALKSELLQLTGVQNVSFTNALPGRPGWQGQWAYAEKISEDHINTEYMAIDENYLNTLGLVVLAGRNFELDRPSELADGLLINETCMREMGWSSPEDAINKRIVSPSGRPEGKVIGVVKDYHGLGLQNHIWPIAMDYSSADYGTYYAIRFETHQPSDLLENVEAKWNALFPSHPFNYSFLDEDFNRQYKKEKQLATLLGVFTVMILLISAIGLLGLVSFVALSKTKEIGIRKTLGASIQQIILLLSKDFMVLVLLGNILAIPLVWYFGNFWLENFAYATSLRPHLFFLTATFTLLVSFITVALQTFKTARMNPTLALRNE